MDGLPGRYTLAAVSCFAPAGWDDLSEYRDAARTLRGRLTAAAAGRGLCKFTDADDEAARAVIKWLLGEGLTHSDALAVEVGDAIERLKATEPPAARLPVFVTPEDLAAHCPEFASKRDGTRRTWLTRFRISNPHDFEQLSDADGSQSRFIDRLAAVRDALAVASRNGNAK